MAACQHCGREAHERDQFCQYCGHRLDTGATEPSQPALVAAGLGNADGAGYASDTGSMPAASPMSDTSPSPASWSADDDAPVQPSMPVATAAEITDLDTVPDAAPDPLPDAAPDAAPDPLPAAEPKSRLLIRKAASEGEPEREEVLGDRDVAIGRSPSCDVVLEGDELASRRHALIRARGGRYTLVDLGSSNGTYVNGYEIRGESELHDGDRIAVGSHELIFAVGTPGPNASLAGLRAGNLPPQPASATLHPDVLEGGTDTAEVGPAGVQQRVDGTGLELEGGEDGSPAAVSRAESKTAPLSAATPEELEALRLQIADIAGALARKADTETRAAQHYRGALVEARDQLEALLRENQPHQEQEARAREQRDELAAIAREAADHPRHLDYLSRLAENAGEIADALNAAPSGASVLDALREVLARINEALD